MVGLGKHAPLECGEEVNNLHLISYLKFDSALLLPRFLQLSFDETAASCKDVLVLSVR